MEYEKLDIKVKKSWRIARGIFATVWLIVNISILITINFLDVPKSVMGVALIYSLASLVYSIFYITIFPIIQHKRWGYYIGDDKVEIRKGLIFIETSVIPIVRIQHITSSKGPIDRKFGLETIRLSTASGMFQIVGLNEEKGEEISEYLKQKLVKRLGEVK